MSNINKESEDIENSLYIIQTIKWEECQEVVEEENKEQEQENNKKNRKYVFKIRAFGRDKNNKSYYVSIINYKPYFYVKIPDSWNNEKVRTYINHINKKLGENKIQDYKIVKRCDLYGFTAEKKFKFVKLIFNDKWSFKKVEEYISNNKFDLQPNTKDRQELKLYESNMEPYIKFMHEKDILSCGWIKIPKKKCIQLLNITNCDYALQVDWNDVERYESNAIQKLIIASFDLECYSSSSEFPVPEKDPIIQIGTVFSYYGDPVPFRKTIITLGSCSKIKALENDEIYECKTETEMLLKWTELIQKQDPDIITGYNICGFDFRYMNLRAIKLGIIKSFSKLGRNYKEESKYTEKKLASGALGENILKFFNITGRVIIDMFEVFKRDTTLSSFKLDNVAAVNLKELICRYEYKENKEYSYIYTTSIYGIKEESYIHIVSNDGLSDNVCDEKYNIIKITELTKEEIEELNNEYNNQDYIINKPKKLYKIKINGKISLDVFTNNNKSKWQIIKNNKNNIYYSVSKYRNEYNVDETKHIIDQDISDNLEQINGNNISWSKAKDDLGAKEMFKLYKGTGEDRAIIAKYCIMDCVLPIELMEKVQVLNNNIGMANVCSVPLHYLFERGQGVKGHSLVGKECMALGYLIPTIRPPKEDQAEILDFSLEENTNKKKKGKVVNKNGYEGATVFDPVTGIYYDPIYVLDFASLYPRSMIYRNISHECLVMDKQYDHHPDYNFQTVVYRNNDGTTTTCRYAKHKDGRKGILCNILQKLLDKRTETKKIMKSCSNAFEIKIYDGLQNAYKVSANSLYGLLGGATSALYLKDLAASTTATGREMLEFSRNFMETSFNKLFNYALKDKQSYYDFANELFKNTPPHKFKTTLQDFIDEFYNRVNKIFTNEYRIKNKVIYGDTDSVFVRPSIHKISDKIILTNRKALKAAIHIGQLAGDAICKVLPEPEEQVYEKTLWPFIILSKKRYTGNLYEDNEIDYYQKNMGIVLKRRDNAKIVKMVVGGIVNLIMNGDETTENNKNSNKTIKELRTERIIEYIKNMLKQILKGEFDIDKFIISKSLKSESSYKNIDTIAHAYLAKRIGIRNPGNKPETGDRIPYVYIIPNTKKLKKGVKMLQGDKIEDPTYVIENKIEIDYLFYITNQIMKPSIDFLNHVFDNPQKLFDNYINKELNRRNGTKGLTSLIGNTCYSYNNNESDSESESDESESEEENSSNSDDKLIKEIKNNKVKRKFVIEI